MFTIFASKDRPFKISEYEAPESVCGKLYDILLEECDSLIKDNTKVIYVTLFDELSWEGQQFAAALCEAVEDRKEPITIFFDKTNFNKEYRDFMNALREEKNAKVSFQLAELDKDEKLSLTNSDEIRFDQQRTAIKIKQLDENGLHFASYRTPESLKEKLCDEMTKEFHKNITQQGSKEIILAVADGSYWEQEYLAEALFKALAKNSGTPYNIVIDGSLDPDTIERYRETFAACHEELAETSGKNNITVQFSSKETVLPEASNNPHSLALKL